MRSRLLLAFYLVSRGTRLRGVKEGVLDYGCFLAAGYDLQLLAGALVEIGLIFDFAVTMYLIGAMM